MSYHIAQRGMLECVCSCEIGSSRVRLIGVEVSRWLGVQEGRVAGCAKDFETIS